MTICERMFSIMEEQGKRPADLCKLLKIGTAQTTAWKQRNSDPPAKYIMQIAQFLGVTPEFLLTGETSFPTTRTHQPIRILSMIPSRWRMSVKWQPR